jgi:hypothetical protein
MTAAATDARLAIWSAINNWPDLNPLGVSVFARKVTHDDDVALIPSNQTSGIGDLTAVEVFPVNENPDWQTHKMQHVPYTVVVRIVTTKLATIEDLIQKTIKGLYQSGTTATVSYVKAATGYHPQSTRTTISRVSLGEKARKIKVWQADIAVLLQFNRDPFA